MAEEIKINELYNADCKVIMRQMPDNFVNVYYTDTPYNLGSYYNIDSKGHIVFKGKGSDFMNQWEAMDGYWWDDYFKEVYRTLKPGGFWISHNIDRQSWLWCYYAVKNNLIPTQKLYWLYIDSFPKGVDLSKQIDSLLGEDRIVVGKKKTMVKKSQGVYGDYGHKADAEGYIPETIPTSELARKYAGFYYGIATLKQVVEEILVFYKEPMDTVPKDIIAHEKGNKYIHPSVYNLKATAIRSHIDKKLRWTPQLLVHTKIAPKMLSEKGGVPNSKELAKLLSPLPQIAYTDEDLIPYIYEPKISPKERDENLENFESITIGDGRKKDIDNPSQRGKTLRKNPHPSPKPKRLVKWILNLFKPPDPILVVDTFMGSGTIPQCCKEENIDYIGIELDKEFFKICRAKLKEI